MPASGISLVDLNVWLALAFDGHVHHPTALRWFERGAANAAGFCRITQLGLLRLLTNRSVMGPFVLTQRGAWEGYERLCRDERVVFLEEPMDLEKHWRQLTRQDSMQIRRRKAILSSRWPPLPVVPIRAGGPGGCLGR